MPAKRVIWGLVIKPETIYRSTPHPQNGLSDFERIYFSVHIGKFRKGMNQLDPKRNKDGLLFVTNPEIEKRLQDQHAKFEELIGSMLAWVNRFEKQIQTAGYWPYGSPLGAWHFRLGKSSGASFAELMMEKYLQHRFPGFRISSSRSNDLSPERELQLLARKRKPGEAVPLTDAVRLSRDYVARKIKEHRPKRQVKKPR